MKKKSLVKYASPIPADVPPEFRPAPFHRSSRLLRYCVDFGVPENTPVLAARDGIVIARESRFAKSFSDEMDSDKGNYVVLLHADGEKTVYAHLNWRSIMVARNETVRQGQVIALSGQTGYATYPHLHFGTYDKRDKNIKVVF